MHSFHWYVLLLNLQFSPVFQSQKDKTIAQSVLAFMVGGTLRQPKGDLKLSVYVYWLLRQRLNIQSLPNIFEKTSEQSYQGQIFMNLKLTVLDMHQEDLEL